MLSCCFARTGVTTTQNSKTRTPKNSDPSVGTTKIQGPYTRQKRRNGPGRNKHRLQQNLPVYMHKFCKGTDKKMARSSLEERMKTVYTLLFFVTGTDRASDLKLLRLVRMRFRPYIKRQWTYPSYYFCVSLSKEENTNFECNNNVSDNSGKCF